MQTLLITGTGGFVASRMARDLDGRYLVVPPRTGTWT